MGAKRKILGKLVKKLTKKKSKKAVRKTAKKTRARKKTGRQVFAEDSPEDIAKFDRLIDRGKARNKAARRGNPRPTTPRQRMELQDQVKSAGIGHNVAGSPKRKASLQAVKDRMSARKRAKGRPAGSRGKKAGKPLRPNPSKMTDYEEAILKDSLRGRRKRRSRPKTQDEIKAENARKSLAAARSGARKDKRMIQKSRFSKQAPSKSRIKREIDLQAADLRNEAVKKIGKALQQRKKRWAGKAAMKSRVGKTRYPRKKITRH